jgi:hypothetical protein
MEVKVMGRSIWLRAMSELDLQARDEYALLALANRRKELEDPESRANAMYLSWMPAATDEQLRNIILSACQSDLARQAALEIQPRLIPIPDDATEDEKVDILRQRDAEMERVIADRRKFIEDGVRAKQAEIETIDREGLLALARQKQIELQSRLESIRAFESYTIYATCFLDEGCQTRLVNSPEQAGELPPDARTSLIVSYAELDRISQMDLKYFLLTDGSQDSSKPETDSPASQTALAEKTRGKSRGGGRTRY